MNSLISIHPQKYIVGTSANQKENPAVKFLVSGGATLVFEASMGHFFEFLKVLKQTNPTRSYKQLTEGITKAKGISGIWDGFLPWGAVQAAAKGSVFGLGHVLATNTLHPFVESGSIKKDVADVIAGGIGGGFQGLVLSPTLLLKTRVMTNPIFRERMTMGETTRQSLNVGMKVIREEGVQALMKGSLVFSAKRVADWSTRFIFSVMAENVVFKQGDENYKLTRSEQIMSGLLGGLGSTVCTLPLDVAVAQIQQASKAGQKVPLLQLFTDQYKEGGMKQLTGMATRGFTARLAHVALTTALMKTATSMIYDALYQR